MNSRTIREPLRDGRLAQAQRKLPDFLSHQEINEFLNANAKRTDEFAKRDQAILK